MKKFEHQEGCVLGPDLPSWPDDLTTFEERKAYQRGIADERHRAAEENISYRILKEGEGVRTGDQIFYSGCWTDVGSRWFGIRIRPGQTEVIRRKLTPNPEGLKVASDSKEASKVQEIPLEVLLTWKDAYSLVPSDAFGRIVMEYVTRKLNK